MSARHRQSFRAAMLTAGLSLGSLAAGAQALRSSAPQGAPATSADPAPFASGSTLAKPSAGVAALPPAATHSRTARSMLDEPAAPAQIQLTADRLSINATNASLSEVIRQVATQTGMQVEGNSRDQRVFGAYGPGSPPEVLSALLYDSGYNVIMVGSTADGAPRRLMLSARTTSAPASGAAAPARNADEDDAEAPEEAPPQSQPSPIVQPPGTPATPGQPRTPQQMLEELQRMHQGQQPQDTPRE